MADININDNITKLRWDARPINPLSMGYLHCWNDNPVIESFANKRYVRLK